MQFKLDGTTNLGAEDTTSPYSVAWNSTTATNGSHTLTAVARDAAGNIGTSAGVTVTASNASGSTITIGETNILSVNDGGNGNLLVAQPATLSQTATIQSLSFYITTASGNLRLGIYDATGPGGRPGAKKAETASITPTTGWNTVNVITPVSLPAGTYWLAYLASSSSLGFKAERTGGNSRLYPYTFGTMPATFSTTAGPSAWRWSLYATLTLGTSSDATPPTVSITAPASGATVSGTAVAVSADASDNVGVVGVQFKLDGANLGAEDTTSPYSVAWNSTTATNGSHTLTAVARDAAGNTTTSAGVSVTVNNAAPDPTPPTVSITAPASGATVSGTAVTIAATASDNVGVAGVQFKLDGTTNLGAEDTTSPYSVAWNSTTATNGSHTLTAVARDAAGNIGTSAGVTVTANNASGSTITIGETNILSVNDGGNGNLLVAQPATLSQTATIQSLSFYITTASGNLRLGIYDATGPGGRPGAKKAETASITPTTGWNTVNVITPVSLPAGTYWLAYLASSSSLGFKAERTGGNSRLYSFTFGTMPATFSTAAGPSVWRWSLYATLNP